MTLSSITNRKFIETYPGNGRKILTPTGYVEILEVHKTIKYRKFRVELENGMSIECAYNHVLMTNDMKEVYAKDSLNRVLSTTDGPSMVKSVIDLKIEEHMYDISIDGKEEVYYSNGILSHNSGKSVTIAIYLSHTFIFSKDMNMGIAANQAGMAREFLDKTRSILISLPIWLQQGIKAWNKSYIEGENGMRILTSATSGDSFRGFSINCLVVDECVEYNETITVRNKSTNEIQTLKIGDFYKLLN